MGRAKRGSEASSHRPCALAIYRLLLFLWEYHVMFIACCVVGGEMNYPPNRQIGYCPQNNLAAWHKAKNRFQIIFIGKGPFMAIYLPHSLLRKSICTCVSFKHDNCQWHDPRKSNCVLVRENTFFMTVCELWAEFSANTPTHYFKSDAKKMFFSNQKNN